MSSKKLLKRLAKSGKRYDLSVDVMQAKNASDIGVKVVLTIIDEESKVFRKIHGMGIATTFEEAEAKALEKALDGAGI